MTPDKKENQEKKNRNGWEREKSESKMDGKT